MVQTLLTQRGALRQRGADVMQIVTQSDGRCLEAARSAARVALPFAAATEQEQASWQVRSTPTLWIVWPDRQLYVEGELDWPDLWALLRDDD